jgi:hypothetical protein
MDRVAARVAPAIDNRKTLVSSEKILLEKMEPFDP